MNNTKPTIEFDISPDSLIINDLIFRRFTGARTNVKSGVVVTFYSNNRVSVHRTRENLMGTLSANHYDLKAVELMKQFDPTARSTRKAKAKRMVETVFNLQSAKYYCTGPKGVAAATNISKTLTDLGFTVILSSSVVRNYN